MNDAPYPGNMTSNEEVTLLLNSVDHFLERDVVPYVREWEAEDIYPRYMADKMAEMGLFGSTIAPEYGAWIVGQCLYKNC